MQFKLCLNVKLQSIGRVSKCQNYRIKIFFTNGATYFDEVICFLLITFFWLTLYGKATQIYLIVLPIFFSIGAVGWRQTKSDKEVFNFF